MPECACDVLNASYLLSRDDDDDDDDEDGLKCLVRLKQANEHKGAPVILLYLYEFVHPGAAHSCLGGGYLTLPLLVSSAGGMVNLGG